MIAMYITAPTGIAATHIGETTFHTATGVGTLTITIIIITILCPAVIAPTGIAATHI